VVFTRKKLAILRRTEKAMIRGMCGVKLMDKRNTEELITMLGGKSEQYAVGRSCFERREQCFIEGSAFPIAGSHRKGTSSSSAYILAAKLRKAQVKVI